MSNDEKSRTLLEHLPVEIFLKIFDLFPLQHLVTSFFGLNSYIDSIIRSVRNKNHGVKYNDIDAINLLQLFPTSIDRLVIINSETVDLTSLINLRSLSLERGTHTQLNTIRPHYFPMLEILHIKGNELRRFLLRDGLKKVPIKFENDQLLSPLQQLIKNDSPHCFSFVGLHTNSNDDTKIISDLFQIILSNGFPRLRICTALDIGAVAFSDAWTGSPLLRTLNLKMPTDQDDEKLRSKFSYMGQLTTYEHSSINPNIGVGPSPRKRVWIEVQKLKQLESENKFILDSFPWELLFDTNKPPPRFNNSRMTQRPSRQDMTIIQGRILPQTEPYCRASFLIEIALPREYPFKCPEITFLDPIYHPNVKQSGECCGCSGGFGFATSQGYNPRTSLSGIITTIIDSLDSTFTGQQAHNRERLAEYQSNYETFCKKALESTLSYGRPRY